MYVTPQTSLEVTLELGAGLIACAMQLPQVPLPPTPLALLRFARPGKPRLAPFLLALRPFFNFLVRWLSGHNAHPLSLFVDKPRNHKLRPARDTLKFIRTVQSKGYPIKAPHSSYDTGRRRGTSRSARCQSQLEQSSRG